MASSFALEQDMIGEIRLFLGDGIGVYTVKIILKEKGRFAKLRPCSVAERTFQV